MAKEYEIEWTKLSFPLMQRKLNDYYTLDTQLQPRKNSIINGTGIRHNNSSKQKNNGCGLNNFLHALMACKSSIFHYNMLKLYLESIEKNDKFNNGFLFNQVKILLNQRNHFGATPLMIGISVNQDKDSTTYNFSMIKLLLNFCQNNNISIDFTIVDDEERNIFHYCAMKLRFDLMIEIYYFAMSNYPLHLIRYLINAPSKEYGINKTGDTPYDLAQKNLSLQLVNPMSFESYKCSTQIIQHVLFNIWQVGPLQLQSQSQLPSQLPLQGLGVIPNLPNLPSLPSLPGLLFNLNN